jgi:hypothetical protein
MRKEPSVCVLKFVTVNLKHLWMKLIIGCVLR